MSNGKAEQFGLGNLIRERGMARDRFQMDRFTAELQGPISDEGAREQAGLAKNLKSVANAEDKSAPRSKRLDRFHDRAEPRDSSGAQVISITESAGNNHGVRPSQGIVLVPEKTRVVAERFSKDMNAVLIAIRSRKLENGKFHSITRIQFDAGNASGNNTEIRPPNAAGENTTESIQFNVVILDHRIAEQFVARLFHLPPNGVAITFDFNLEVFAHVHGFDPGVAHVLQRSLDGLSLRIDHCFLWGDDDFRFHSSGGGAPSEARMFQEKFRQGEFFLRTISGQEDARDRGEAGSFGRHLFLLMLLLLILLSCSFF